MEEFQSHLIAKFPVFEFVRKREFNLPEEQMAALAVEMHLNYTQMTPPAKRAWRTVRGGAKLADHKFKRNKKLYKLLAKRVESVTEIILNSESVASLSPLKDCQLDSLLELQLSANYLEDFEPFSSLAAPALRDLDLSSNYLAQIRDLSMSNLPQLINLNLAQNIIASIQSLSRIDFPHLKSMNLSGNNLTSIAPLRKTNLLRLKQIDLSSNLISNIQPIQASRFPQIQRINLRINHFANLTDCAKIRMGPKHQCEIQASFNFSNPWVLKCRRGSWHKLSLSADVSPRGRVKAKQSKVRRLILDE